MTKGQIQARIDLMKLENKDVPEAIVVAASDYKMAMMFMQEFENIHVELDVELRQDDWYLIGKEGAIQ